jgi:hypothetical protein
MPDALFNILDFRELPRYLGALLRDHPDFQGIRYTSSHPKEGAEVPCIVHNLTNRTPGHKGIEKYAGRPKYQVQSDDQQQVLQIHTQLMTCVYQWDVYANSGDEADDIAWRLEEFMDSATPHLMEKGVQAFVFDEALQDDLLRISRDFEKRSLRYLGLVEKVRTKTSPTLDRINLRVLYPQFEEYEALLRHQGVETPDTLSRRGVSRILFVSNASPSGIARENDYLEGIDYNVWYDPYQRITYLEWIEAGRRPADGVTYYVRYLYWEPVTTLSVNAQNFYPYPFDYVPLYPG